MADASFIVRDSGGRVIADPSRRGALLIGDMLISSESGSVTVPEFGLGTPWWVAINNGLGGLGYRDAAFTLSGTTLSWSRPNPTGDLTTIRLLYGFY